MVFVSASKNKDFLTDVWEIDSSLQDSKTAFHAPSPPKLNTLKVYSTVTPAKIMLTNMYTTCSVHTHALGGSEDNKEHATTVSHGHARTCMPLRALKNEADFDCIWLTKLT